MEMASITPPELVRLILIYIHLIACCVAIGLVLTSDVAMVKRLIIEKQDQSTNSEYLINLQQSVYWALIFLWVSGIAIVTLDTSEKGWNYFNNPKLQAKILIVTLLTVNGVALHHRVLPWMKKSGSLLRLSFSRAMWSIFSGTVSGISWFYAAMLGVGKVLSWRFTLPELLLAYPFLITLGFFSMLWLIARCKYGSSGEPDSAFAQTQSLRYQIKSRRRDGLP
jgi:hypothetical protein